MRGTGERKRTRPSDGNDARDPARIAALLRAGDLDAAIEAGLMAPGAGANVALDHGDQALIARTRQRLQAAWDARERYRARQARLARRAAEREARRRATGGVPATRAAGATALPAAAAAALARARARAGQP